MALPAIIEDSSTDRDRRGAHRRTLKLRLAGAGGPEGAVAVLVHDISSSGLLIETDEELAVGTSLDVDLPETGLRAARVVWSRERFCGCELSEPLSQAGSSAALLKSDPREPWKAAFEPGTAAGAQPTKLPFGARMAVIALLAIASWALVFSLFLAVKP